MTTDTETRLNPECGAAILLLADHTRFPKWAELSTIKVTQSMTAPFVIELSSGYEWSLIGEEFATYG